MTEPQVEIEKRVDSKYLYNRAFLIFLGLVLLLVPVAIVLVYLYENMQLRYKAWELPPIPSLEKLSDIVQKFDPELTDPQLEVTYEATPHLIALHETYQAISSGEMEERMLMLDLHPLRSAST